MESWTVLITWTFKLSVPQKQNCLEIGWKNESCDCTSTFYLYFRICNPLYIITLSEQSLMMNKNVRVRHQRLSEASEMRFRANENGTQLVRSGK